MKRKCIIVIILTLFIIPFCQSQKIQYRKNILPKLKQKLDSLYPAATGISISKSRISDTTQEIYIDTCNCQESSYQITLLFDTNGNLLNKDLILYGFKNLPDTIVNYMKKNTSPSVKFLNHFITKSINNKGEISYSITMQEDTNKWSRNYYILKFKSTGELISKEKQLPLRID
jgi:hypothetical protein